MKNAKLLSVIFILFLNFFSNNLIAQNWNKTYPNNKAINNRHYPVAGIGSWNVLGTVHANYSLDHDVLNVPGQRDYYSKLKFRVTDAPVNIRKMLVRYHSGAPQIIQTRYEIPRGGESRIIDLRGGTRKIKSIEFWYDTKGIFQGTADVTVYGRR
ncbi:MULTISPECIES: hypothetical protein [Flavobacterium]|uniref:hypothetical protein n=1 Tax=Flavobacterium TaxID=237 RepID=UPI002481C98D|nr:MULTISPECIES: hypothetical protein [Flavobacterium]